MWPFWYHFVAVLVCGRFCMWPIWLWPFWFVAVLDVHHHRRRTTKCRKVNFVYQPLRSAGKEPSLTEPSLPAVRYIHVTNSSELKLLHDDVVVSGPNLTVCIYQDSGVSPAAGQQCREARNQIDVFQIAYGHRWLRGTVVERRSLAGELSFPVPFSTCS